MAHLCVETVERAERYDADHELIVALQDRLLPSLPLLTGVQASARYFTSGSEATVGGDWYEGLLLGSGRMALIVGDVVGHGITAAADMALIRGMISALLHARVAPAEIFTELTDLLSRDRLTPTGDRRACHRGYSCVHHHLHDSGAPAADASAPRRHGKMLDDANGTLIGASIEPPRTAHTAPFPVGARLVMYTDGLVERRGRSIDDGMHEVATHLAAIPASLEPAQVIESLCEALIGRRRTDDDVAVLVVEHR